MLQFYTLALIGWFVLSYQLAEHIYVAKFQEELIILDTKKDKYIICSEEIKHAIESVLAGNPISSSSYPFSALIQAGILIEGGLRRAYDRKPDSAGAANVDWLETADKSEPIALFTQLKGFLTLTRDIVKSCVSATEHIL